jgi:type II secretory pathway pseudopilin PulG
MNRHRHGITLVEMQVVITLMGVLLGLSGVCLHTMYRAQARLDGNIQRRAALDRLELQLRTDAHSAVTARLLDDEAATMLVLTAPDGTEIVYRAPQSDVSRTVRAKAAEEAGQIPGADFVHRDTFRLPGAAGVEWKLSDDAQPVVAMTVLPTDGLARNGTAVPTTIRTAVGWQALRQQISTNHRPAEPGGDEP